MIYQKMTFYSHLVALLIKALWRTGQEFENFIMWNFFPINYYILVIPTRNSHHLDWRRKTSGNHLASNTKNNELVLIHLLLFEMRRKVFLKSLASKMWLLWSFEVEAQIYILGIQDSWRVAVFYFDFFNRLYKLQEIYNYLLSTKSLF